MEKNRHYYDQLLLAFLSRESVHISEELWQQTINYIRHLTGDFCHQSLAYEMPEWSILKKFSTEEWSKYRNQLQTFEERGLSFLSYDQIPLKSKLRQLKDPPRCLVILGNPKVLEYRFILSVVGSRDARADLLTWMDQQLSMLLKENPDVLVVSGGARGVDQQAHICAIRQQKATLIWLPSGVLNLYPQNLSSWVSDVIGYGGAFISEYHPLSSMKKWYFHQRNRLVVGMSDICWIPQSRVRSGSWMSACLAAEAGVPLFVNPAHPWDTQFSGNIRLLSEGANCINSYQDLLNEFCMMSSIDRDNSLLS